MVGSIKFLGDMLFDPPEPLLREAPLKLLLHKGESISTSVLGELVENFFQRISPFFAQLVPQGPGNYGDGHTGLITREEMRNKKRIG